tara:strand:- start:164684 stop:165370 length:687 start_codon:yes stop_codon:yes gene_type:complete
MIIDYSVVIPAYNAADTIGEAVHSVLAQSIPPAEIIVVDDGSTDQTAAVVTSLSVPITLIQQENKGCGEATNTGFRAVKTPLLASLDADDIWLPDKMKVQLDILNSDTDVAAIFCRAKTFRDLNGMREFHREADLWARSTMVVWTELALANGKIIDPPGGLGDMIDWLGRLRENGHVLHMHPQVLVHRRIRPGSLSYARTEESNRGYVFAARQAILRRRAASKTQQDG